MSDRRSFFKSLALIGAAAVGCPGIFIPKFEPVRWKAPSRFYRINPEWVDATYALSFIGHSGHELVWFDCGPSPRRFEQDEKGGFVEIPMVIPA